MVVDENKPIMLLCLYFDADVFFIHGLFKSRTSTIREFLKAIRVAEKFMGENVFGKFPVISFTTKNTIKKFLLKNKFKREEITMLVRGIQ